MDTAEGMNNDLTRQFHVEMEGNYRAAVEIGYRATGFWGMVIDHGALEAAKRLLRESEEQSGLTRLWELGRLDLSVEALVLQERWNTLFSDEERQKARDRLDEHEYYA